MTKLMKMVLSAWPVLRSICVGGCLVLGAGVATAAELPAGYTAIDHIVAPRGAYIDTGYRPNQNTRVVMDVTVQGVGEYWFGCWDRNYNDGAFAFGNDGGGIYAGYGKQGGTFGSVVANGRHSVELDKNAVKVDGGQVHAFNAATFALANNLYLFAQNRNGEIGIAGAQTTIVCHGCAIYDNGTQVRDFVPCTSPSGRTGLYDQIGQRFYALAVKLPSGYTAVEYIESTKGGKQFIDTGYTANGQTKVVFNAVIPARWEQNDRFGILFGSRTMNAWAEKAFALQMCDGNTAVDTVRFVYNGEYRQDGSKPFSFGERVTVTCDGQHVEWTGSKAASVDFTAESLASSKSTLYIFADNTVADDGAKSETGLNHSVMRLYSFRITEGETLKRDFVTCVRLADAVAGLYDMVEGKFYGNSGSGNFATSASNLPFGRELASGTYEINESFAFAAPPMESALKIAEGATVTLNISAGVTVALRGGDAFEVWGAGAGIEVPANATLKMTGVGQLVAYGGKGANGCDGMAGGNGSADGSNGNFTSGAGGAGGWGGGGAGAGIGGHGANGGGGGNGGKAVTGYGWSYTDIPGNNGDNGGNGKDGGTCGTVSIEGTVKVFAAGGAAGDADGGAGGEGGEGAWIEGSTYYFGGWGGGGGGSGSKGGAAQDIGGGGAGGYGGGGGGSGGYLSRFTRNDFFNTFDNGGGGAGVADGECGYIASPSIFRGSTYPGGAKGAAAARGGCGTLSVTEFAVVVSAFGESDSYSVGQISATEHIRWEGGELYRVVDGVRTKLPYSVVDANTFSLGSGWYVVKEAISRGKIDVNGTANLVLLHNSSLTVLGGSGEAGVAVYRGQALGIFGVESGSLTTTGGSYGAGIGGGDKGACGSVTINGGMVTATGGRHGAGIGGGKGAAGGTVTINGGEVTAQGGDSGAGIGGGDLGVGGEVTINGGTVTAMGGKYGAGIGGGESGVGGEVTINGGTVTATGGFRGAGIGGGRWSAGGAVMITGGAVKAVPGEYAADIGRGDGDGSNGMVSITGGIFAMKINDAWYDRGLYAVIDNSDESTKGDYPWAVVHNPIVTIPALEYATVSVATNGAPVVGFTGGELIVPFNTVAVVDYAANEGWGIPGTTHFEATVTGDLRLPAEGNEPTVIKLCKVTVPALTGTTVSVTTNGAPVAGFAGGELLVSPNTKVTVDYAANEGWVIFENTHFAATVTGDLRLPAEGSEPTVFRRRVVAYMAVETNETGEITFVERTTNAVVVTEKMDKFKDGHWYVVTGEVSRGGIDVVANGTANLILADGASLTVQGDDDDVGIDVRLGETLNIYAQRYGTGRLMAMGGGGGAGIGGVHVGAGGAVTINGGVVTAKGGQNGAGIGGGSYCDGGKVTINGGSVTAMGGKWAAGVGGGWNGVGGTVTINGGEMTATGGDYGAGIGGGASGAGGIVTVNDGSVAATGGIDGAGIGGGGSGAGGIVTINGGTVTATGKKSSNLGSTGGAGIGGGDGGEDGTVTLDVTKVVVVEGAYGNGYSYVKIVEKAPMVVPVTPGEPVVFDTAVEATNAMANAVVTPSEEVAAALGSDAAIATYRDMFGLDVSPTTGGKWVVAALLLPEPWTNVVLSAQAATRQIPVADIAALELGVETNVTVKGCGVPGFYYSLYSGSSVTNLTALASEYGRNVLCGTDTDVDFSGVVKPSDAAGFFSVGAKETPGVGPSDRAELDPPAITDVGTYGN